MTSSRLLAYTDHHELGGVEGSETDQEVDDTRIPVILGGGGGIALDEVGLFGSDASEGSMTEQALKEIGDYDPDSRPQASPVGSNTAQRIPLSIDCSINSPVRLTERYFHSGTGPPIPLRVRAPRQPAWKVATFAGN